MQKIFAFLILSLVFISNGHAERYSDISPGDFYYINGWTENDHVIVVEKLDNSRIKVRKLNNGDTLIVYASDLLTKDNLDKEETRNAVGGAVLFFCLMNPESCKK